MFLRGENMKVKDAQKLRDALLIVGMIIMLGAYLYEVLFGIGMAIAFSSLIPHFLYNKGPHCGKQLGRNEGKYCQYCGEKIDD